MRNMYYQRNNKSMLFAKLELKAVAASILGYGHNHICTWYDMKF